MKNEYRVEKYFDTYPDGVSLITEDEELAKKECKRMNEKVKHLPHTEYIVRKYTKDIK